MAAPRIHTYHCLCTTLLLATTHNLSSLPRRSPPSLDNAIILPQTALPISTEDNLDSGTTADLSAEGYSVLSGMQRDPVSRMAVVRREDGFERRVLWRCGRCRLVVGYEIEGEGGMDGSEKGKGKEREQVVYLLPGGILSTEAMASGKKIGEADVEIGTGKGVGVWES